MGCTRILHVTSLHLQPQYSMGHASPQRLHVSRCSLFHPRYLLTHPSDTSPECDALGRYLARSKDPKPTNPLMKSKDFTIIIRDVGPFDHTGRQPGFMIQTTNFTLCQLEKGFVPGERRVEIWRNGEPLQLFGLIALMADRCAWFLGDPDLRRGMEATGMVGGLDVGIGQP